MNIRLSTGFAALGCALLASCYPINEKPQDQKVTTTTTTKTTPSPDQLRLKEEEALKQKEQEALARENTPPETSTTTSTTTSNGKTKPSGEAKLDYTFANKVPGKDGFVFSPYNNKVVDVRDIPSGTLVQDPTYPAAEKKYFRVP